MPTPTIRDWKTLRISLKRTECFGTCPVYSVEIMGDGTVRYQGHLYVAKKGAHKAQISQDSVRSLFQKFVAADFFWTLDEYTAWITDQPTYVLKLSFDGHTKTVIDYAGRAACMPGEITDLEQAVDTAAQTSKWVKGKSAESRAE